MCKIIEKVYNSAGNIDARKIKHLSSDETKEIEEMTNFLQLNPTISQRITTLRLGVLEHKKCSCGNYLPYSSEKNAVFKEFCSMSCSKKGRHNSEITKKFRDTISSNKTEIDIAFNSAKILNKQDVIDFFARNLSLFSNGGSKGINFLNKNLDYKKSLFFYTSESSINGKIYELLNGIGACEICGEKTVFVSLEKGYKNYCFTHGKMNAAKRRGMNAISMGIEKLKSFENFSDFEIISIPQKLNAPIILSHKVCGELFELYLNNGKVDRYILRCGNCQSTSISNPEIELKNWIKEIGIDCVPQYKIGTKRIDIVIPDKKLAIEYNGLMDHSFGISKHSRWNNSLLENPNNHAERTILCESEGLRLLHIFENEWLSKTSKEIWKSIISTNLNLNERIYARNCEIKEITDNSIIRSFLNLNHLQGYCKSSIKIGLYYNNELVSLMTFGKPRFNKKYEWELIRFCNKINISIIGGSSKLFNYFIRNYVPNTIISYCDIRIFSGEMYDLLGFEYSHKSEPNYFYFKGTKILSRYDCQKHKLKEFLSNFDPKLSEKDNMFNNGYRRIWDCGNKVYVWEKE